MKNKSEAMAGYTKVGVAVTDSTAPDKNVPGDQ